MTITGQTTAALAVDTAEDDRAAPPPWTGSGLLRAGHRPGAAGRLPQRARRARQDRGRPPRTPSPCAAPAGRLPHGQAAPPPGAQGRQDRPRQGRHRVHRDRFRSAHRRRDRGHPALLRHRRRRDRGDAPAPARSCYICKKRYVEVDYFYHQLCQDCAAENRARPRRRRRPRGKRALLTGGRAKIGMYIALRLLRDGAHHHHQRASERRDPALQGHARQRRVDGRLKIVGIDLRDPAQVVALASRSPPRARWTF